ncbi:MAG: ABC transporter permease [Ardenticatenaceae bacterium]|nr:ABC transporter permease [Ardenticatenaceae bacterium]
MSKIVKMAWRNMWRNWRRTLIASVAIILGMILLIFMDALIKGSDQAIYGNAVRMYGGNVQVHAPGYREKADRLPLLPLADAETVVATIQSIDSPEKILATAKRINTGGMVSTGAGTYPVTITAIEPEKEAPVSLFAENISDGRFLTSEDGDAIVIGQNLADLLEVGVGDRVMLVGRRLNESMRQRTMTVVGIYSLGMDSAERGTVFINLPTAQTLYNLRQQETEVVVSLEKVGQEDVLIEDLQAKLPNYEVDSWDTLSPEIQQAIQSKSMATSILGMLVVLIASIGILNLMLMAVYERTREMGVLAALGMKGRQITTLFLLEGTFIGVFGAVVGVIAGGLLVAAVAQVGIDISGISDAGGGAEVYALMGTRMYPAFSLTTSLVYAFLVMVISAAASFFPAWQASRQEPAEALHHI